MRFNLSNRIVATRSGVIVINKCDQVWGKRNMRGCRIIENGLARGGCLCGVLDLFDLDQI